MFSLRSRVITAVVLVIGALSAVPAQAATPPPAPTGIAIAPGSDSAKITWKASAGADYYALCLVEQYGSTRCAHASPRVTGTTYTFTGLAPTSGKDFYVRVRATNAAGGTNSARIGFDLVPATSVPPAAPTDVTAVPSYDSAKITWKAASGAGYYALCLLEEATSTRCAHSSGRVTGTTFTFTGLAPTDGTDYYVRVNATNAQGTTGSARVPFDLTPDPRPAPATGLEHRVSGYSAVDISWDAVPKATQYTVCLLAQMGSTSCSHTATTTSTTARLDGLAPTSGRDWYYRIKATAGAYSSQSALGSFDLPVGAPPSVKAESTGIGAAKAWWATGKNAGSYEVEFALNSSMTSGNQVLTTTEPRVATKTLSPGRAYWFRVRGLNDTVKGSWSGLGTVRTDTGATSITVMTYNLCGQDKCVTSANKMARWNSTRKKAAGSYVRAGQSGIIATQESHERDTRFGTELPGYKLAAYYSAKSLFYDTSLYSKERSGTITLSSADKKYAVWGQFRSIEDGTRFLVVDAHLQPYKGKANDDKRYYQSRVLIQQTAKANTDQLPVVYAGDFNSNKSNTDQRLYKYGYDAPLKVFTEAGIPDTINTATDAVTYFSDWNSANQAINPPLRHSDHVDHVFADKDIKVTEWRMMLRAAGGRYTTPFASDHNPLRVKLTIPGS